MITCDIILSCFQIVSQRAWLWSPTARPWLSCCSASLKQIQLKHSVMLEFEVELQCSHKRFHQSYTTSMTASQNDISVFIIYADAVTTADFLTCIDSPQVCACTCVCERERDLLPLSLILSLAVLYQWCHREPIRSYNSARQHPSSAPSYLCAWQPTWSCSITFSPCLLCSSEAGI